MTNLEPRSLGDAHQPAIIPRRVLLAEDDYALRDLLVAMLREDGHEVHAVVDGAELVAVAKRDRDAGKPWDVVVSDVVMPRMNGLFALVVIRRLDPPPPVILITAFGDPDVHFAAGCYGARAVFDKPFDLDDLRTVLANL